MTNKKDVTVRFFRPLDASTRDIVPTSGIDLAMRHLEGLSTSDRSFFYTGSYFHSVPTCSPSAPRMKLSKVMTRGLPSRLRLSDEREANLDLAEDEGLAYPTFMKFFEAGVVALLAMPNGPTRRQVEWYLSVKAQHQLPNLKLEPILKSDIARRLRDYETVEVLRVKLASTEAEALRGDEASAAKYLRQLSECLGGTEIEVVVRDPARQRSFRGGLKKHALKFLGTVDEVAFVSLEVRGKPDGTATRQEPLDLLSDLVGYQQQVLVEDERHARVAEQSAWDAIDGAAAQFAVDSADVNITADGG